MTMTSTRPYLLRAIYEWLVDNACTPQILVDAHVPGTQVPQQYLDKHGHILLNISPTAVQDFCMDLTAVAFNARFGGIPYRLYIPCNAIQGIYARENGQGMMFGPDSAEPPEPPTVPPPINTSTEKNVTSIKRPGLRVVK
jgi:stringent starvation protein B